MAEFCIIYMMTSNDVLKKLKSLASPERAKVNAWFFKTGPGQYGEGDKFWGLRVPQIRTVVKEYKELPIEEILKLLRHEVHEVRLCAVLMLVVNYKKYPEIIYKIYLDNTKFINNWDLVDLSAGYIIGDYLKNRSKDPLFKLAKSKNIWERRIAMIATFYDIKNGNEKAGLKIAEILINDKHDLIQKAVGWMLREIGKRCSVDVEEKFLRVHASTMPRTTLRYAIEHFPQEKRMHYLQLKNNMNALGELR